MKNEGQTDDKPLQLRCPCGLLIKAIGDDQIVEAAEEHLQRDHPDLAGTYSRDEILFMAYLNS